MVNISLHVRKTQTVDGDSQKRNTDNGNAQAETQSRPSNTKKRPERGQDFDAAYRLPPRETGDSKKPFGGSKQKAKPKNRA